MFLISLEPDMGFVAKHLKGNYTCLGRGVCMRCHGKKSALGISRTAPWCTTLVLSRPGEGVIAEV